MYIPCEKISKAGHEARMCRICNLSTWLEQIKILMPGLQSVDLCLHLSPRLFAPSFDEIWVQRILALQQGTKILKNLHISEIPRMAQETPSELNWIGELRDFETRLKAEVFRVGKNPSEESLASG